MTQKTAHITTFKENQYKDKRDQKRMGMSKNWVAVVRRKFFRTSPRETIIILYTNDTTSNFSQEDAVGREDAQNDMATFAVSTTQKEELVLSKEDIAATKIQAYFRRHLVLIPPLILLFWLQMLSISTCKTDLTDVPKGIDLFYRFNTADFESKAGISSTKGTCQAASSGSRCLREKTGAYSFALYAYTSPLASNGSSSSASQQSNVALINQSSEVL